jgi:hypothetical protein
MKRYAMFGLLLSVCAMAVVIGTFAIAEDKPAAPAGMPEMKLPPGWTPEDMQACMIAATPGEMQKHLHKSVGTWEGKSQMWMFPGSEPMNSNCTAVISDMMDGRFVKVDWSGDMPGMGPFKGFGINGYDNSSKKFVSMWVDSMSTGIMNGTGDLSADGKTMNWNFNYTCPVTKKPAVMRQVETATGENTKTLEMFGHEPKSGKEYKMMSIELTRK